MDNVKQYKIFVSSTFTDLVAYREAVQDVIRQMGHIDVSMEHFGSRDDRPLDGCLKLLQDCDFFVGIYAHRYGSIPPSEIKSIAELEYDKATIMGITKLIYLIEKTTPWNPTLIDKSKDAKKLRLFKQKLSGQIYANFTNKDDLAKKVAADLGREIQLKSLARVENSLSNAEQTNPLNPKTKKEWNEFRWSVYKNSKHTFIAHTIKPAGGKNFDVSVYLLRHTTEKPDTYTIHDIIKAEFFFGKNMGDQVFEVKNTGGPIGIVISLYGPILCTCRVTFADGEKLFLSKYIDLEMESVLK
jgi:hypothetical protein